MKNDFAFAKTRQFAPLFGTQFLGAFNDNLFKNSLFALISFYGLGKNDWLPPEQMLNLGALLFVLPYFLFSTLAGQLATRFDKARLARAVKVFEMAIMALAGWGFSASSAPVLLLCLFLMGVHSTIFGPVKYAILPEYLGEKHLLTGNGLIESGTFLAILFGQILGAAMAGHGSTVLTVVVFVVAAAGFASSLFMPSAPPQNPQAKIHWNLWRDTKELWRQIRAQNELRTAILGISWFWLVGAVYTTQLLTFTQLHLGGNANVFNLMLTLFSIGIAAGSVLCSKASKGSLHLIWVLFGSIGLSIFGGLLVYLTHTLHFAGQPLQGIGQFLQRGHAYPIMLAMLGIGFFGGFFSVPLYTWLQMRSSDEFRAHAIAANNIANAVFMVAAAIASAVLLKLFDSVQLLYLLVAVGNLPMLAYLVYRYPAIFRRQAG